MVIMIIAKLRKQPPEVLCKKRCSQKFHKIHRKTPVPKSLFIQLQGKHLCQSLFNKVAGATLLKKRLCLALAFSCEFCKISENTFSTEHLQTTASSSFSGKRFPMQFMYGQHISIFDLTVKTYSRSSQLYTVKLCFSQKNFIIDVQLNCLIKFKCQRIRATYILWPRIRVTYILWPLICQVKPEIEIRKYKKVANQ